MSKELRQVANGFDSKVKAYSGYDVNGYRFHTRSYERARPHRKTTNSGVCTPGTDGLEYHGIIEDIYELEFYGSKPLRLVMFKCHWFNPRLTKRSPNIGQVEIRHDSIYQGKDVFIVADQAMQVYYLSYACQGNKALQGWSIVHQVSPHGRLAVPNDEDYNFNPNTYDGEFYQEDGLQGRLVIDLTEAIGMEVDNERVDDEEEGDEVQNAKDIEMLERLHLDDDDEGNIEPSDSLVYLDNFDSDDETYDPDNPNNDDYF